MTVTPTAPTVDPGTADRLVLTVDELNTLAGAAQYEPDPLGSATRTPLVAEDEVDPGECAPALRGLLDKSVAGSGTSAFRGASAVTIGDPALPEDKRRKDSFVQVVAVYPAVASAQRVFTAFAAGVQACAGRKAALRGVQGPRTEYDIAVEATAPAQVRWSQHQSGWGPNQRCVLEARLVKNIVFEEVECGLDVGGFLAQAVGKVAGRAG